MNAEQKIKWILIIVWTVAVITMLISIAQIAAATDSGYVIFYARGVTVQDPYIYVSNDDGVFANLSWLPDHSETVPDLTLDNPGMLLIKLQPDGFSDTLHMAAGNYTAYMRQSNADQPETRTFRLANGWTERVVFLGAAYASGDEGCCSCHNVTVVDVPGSIIHHDEINHTIFHPPGIEVVYIQEVNHTEWRYQTHYHVTDTKFVEGWGWKVKCTYPGHVFKWHYQDRDCTKASGWSEWLIVDPLVLGEESRIIVDVPAHTETRPIGEPWIEIVVDVPAWDEQAGAVTHEERICGQKLVCPCGCVRSG